MVFHNGAINHDLSASLHTRDRLSRLVSFVPIDRARFLSRNETDNKSRALIDVVAYHKREMSFIFSLYECLLGSDTGIIFLES